MSYLNATESLYNLLAAAILEIHGERRERRFVEVAGGDVSTRARLFAREVIERCPTEDQLASLLELEFDREWGRAMGELKQRVQQIHARENV